ncbi:MAG: SufE family protein [Bacteroidia bacterium]|nr:SufE family protein [Bacteroidia bacterium]NND51511.1 SufE family protein [Flavobacteriaceae bacterium]
MSITEIQNELIDEFAMFDDWMQRYEYMIELGKTLPLIDDRFKTDDNLIKGCQSKVWLHAEMHDNKVIFTADSDAIITKGIIAILIRVFSNQSPQDIIDAETDFIDEIGLKEHLSPTRANGLVSMIKQLKLYAIAYQTQLSK